MQNTSRPEDTQRIIDKTMYEQLLSGYIFNRPQCLINIRF